MERNNHPREIRSRLYPGMKDLYDIAINAYRKSLINPKIVEETDHTGKISKIHFNIVPPAVMSKIYNSTMERKDHIDCRFTLEYKLLPGDNNLMCRFEIRK
jgi:hypothetical protein